MTNPLGRGSRAPARALLLFSAIAMLVLIGAACGSSSGSSSSTSTSSTSAAATTATTASAAASSPAAASAASSPSGTPESSEADEYGSPSASPSGTPESSEADEYGSPSASPVSGSSTTAGIKTSQNAKLGTILTDASGRTLYIFKKDSMNVSNCNGDCAQIWPPLTTSGTPSLASGIAGTLGTINRGDGTKQVTYNGMPLYHFQGDTKPGDAKGQAMLSLWYVVNPSAQ